MTRTCAFGADAVGPLTDALLDDLARRGIAIERFGAVRSPDDAEWTSIARAVAETVAAGRADLRIVCCWTGTGVSIAANKVRGVRAALCADAATASGARRWNDANVLAFGLRLTTESLAAEMLDAFLSTPFDDA